MHHAPECTNLPLVQKSCGDMNMRILLRRNTLRPRAAPQTPPLAGRKVVRTSSGGLKLGKLDIVRGIRRVPRAAPSAPATRSSLYVPAASTAGTDTCTPVDIHSLPRRAGDFQPKTGPRGAQRIAAGPDFRGSGTAQAVRCVRDGLFNLLTRLAARIREDPRGSEGLRPSANVAGGLRRVKDEDYPDQPASSAISPAASSAACGKTFTSRGLTKTRLPAAMASAR